MLLILIVLMKFKDRCKVEYVTLSKGAILSAFSYQDVFNCSCVTILFHFNSIWFNIYLCGITFTLSVLPCDLISDKQPASGNHYQYSALFEANKTDLESTNESSVSFTERPSRETLVYSRKLYNTYSSMAN